MKRAGIGFPSRLVSLFSRLARRQTDALHPVSAYDPPDHRDIISPSDEMETQRKELPMNAVDILKYGHQTVLQAIEGFPETAMDVPGACGAWSAKDILAHLASYEHTLFEVLSTFANPHATPYLDRMSSLGNQFNDTEVEKRKGKSMKEILDEFNDTHTQVLELSTQISPETSRQSGTLPWYGMEYALDDFIVYTSYGHKCEHSAQIAAFRDRLRREAAVQEDALTATTVEVVEQLNEALNRRDVDAVMALMNDDVVFENTYPPPDGQRYEGRRALRAFFEDFFHATPHVDFQTEDLFASGNRCTARWVFHWSNTAGENGHIRGIDVINLRNWKVAENFSYVKG
jgi:ketosteroid isomerase-like protein